MQFPKRTFGKRLTTMLHVDGRRMFTTPFLYILLGICLLMPVLILVMTTMMDGSVTVDPQTGAETVIEGFDNTWQAIGASSDANMMSMDLTGMCNINMLYFFMAVLVGVFVAADFRSGYAKNLFTTRSGRGEYIFSKTVFGILGGALMLLAFFVGTCLGGAVAGLPFTLGAGGVSGLVLCMAGKLLLTAVFVPIYLLWSVAAKEKLWLSILGSMMTGMLLFMMVPMLTPLDAKVSHVLLCLAGGAVFSLGLGAIGSRVLKKAHLV